jgi:pimeloyl-ACP methyl ester carboxylesterase
MMRGRPILPSRATIVDADLNCLPPDEQQDVYDKMVPASGKQGMEAMSVEVDAQRLRGPRLIVSGMLDRLIPVEIHRKMAVAYGAAYHEYPHRAHYIMREPGWENVADNVMRWFDRMTAAAAGKRGAGTDVHSPRASSSTR